MPFEIIDGVSSADIAFRVRADNLPELFIVGARALVAIMLDDPATVREKSVVTFTCESPELDLLYFDFLHEFIFQKDAGRLILLPRSVVIDDARGGYRLSCEASGETIERERHRFIVDIKAVTLHGLSVTRHGGTWTATAVVDV
jgi:SHS2 domain-containing protein